MPIFSPELLPLSLCLPQDDPMPSRREEELSQAQDAYAYTYDKPNLRGVAMLKEAPKSEAADPAWLLDVVGVVKRNLENGVELEEEEGNRPADMMEKSLEEVRSLGIQGAFKQLQNVALHGDKQGPPIRLGDYARLFQAWDLPEVGAEAHLDSSFGRMRVAGPNPAWITQVKPDEGLPEDFAVGPPPWPPRRAG